MSSKCIKKYAKGGTSDQSLASELTYSSLIRLQVEGDQENQESQCQVGVIKLQFLSIREGLNFF